MLEKRIPRSDVYDVKGPFEDLRIIIPPRRSARVRIWPYLNDAESEAICTAIKSRFVPEMADTTTFEPPWRPVPWVSPIADLAAVGNVCEKWFPRILAWLRPLLKPGPQSYPRQSRLGWPYFEVVEDKIAVLLPWIYDYLAGKAFPYEQAFGQINVRLQSTDPPGKDRHYLFVTAEGNVFEATVTFEDRRDPKTGRVASRTRLVFNYPVMNLITQCVDNTFHRALMRFPMFHHNMQALVRQRWRAQGECVAFDIRHMERLTGYAALIWARVVGGDYGEAITQMFHLPLLCPAIGKGRENFAPMMLRARPEAGLMQLGSGLSCVSVIQKLLMFAVYAEYCDRHGIASGDEALSALASHRTPFRVLNQGDDNFVDFSGSEQHIEPMYEMLEAVLPGVDIELPPAFLRFIYDPATGFALADRSLVLNTTDNERAPGSRFRRYPHWGWLQKCLHFEELGTPFAANTIIPAFYAEFAKFGVTRDYIQGQALSEYTDIRALRLSALANWKVATEKEYLLTEEEKAQMPSLYAFLSPQLVASIVRKMLPGG